VPFSVAPDDFSASVARRSPSGVLMVMFQFPSTDISLPSNVPSEKPEWFCNQDGPVIYIAF
jgi:hypothetical protein